MNNIFFIKDSDINWLFIYFFIIMIISMLGVPFWIYLHSESIFNINITTKSLIGGILSALLGCSIFYSRKLYKKLINKEYDTNLDNSDKKLAALGLFKYYLLRPFFSVAFCFLAFMLLKTGVKVFNSSVENIDEGFLYFFMILSFFVGFSIGDFIDAIEKKSREIVEDFADNIGQQP